MRVVLDTSVLLSALLFPKGPLTWIRDLWKSEKIIPLTSKETAQELIRALAYPKFNLNQDEIELILSDYLPYTKVIKLKRAPRSLPKCRDKKDQVFLNLASFGKANYLVSSDKDLLVLSKKVDFQILSPKEFKKMF